MSKETVSIRIDPEDVKRLEAEAFKQDRTVSFLIRKLVRQFLELIGETK